MNRIDSMTVRELVRTQVGGEFDVLQFQRSFSRPAEWVWELVDSMLKGIPISALLVWMPDAEDRPVAGRYRARGGAPSWIVDGQQRSAGLCAALGLRPAWITYDQWRECGAEDLEVRLTCKRGHGATLAPWKATGPQVPLGVVYRAKELGTGPDLPTILAQAGFPDDQQLLLSVADLLQQFLGAEVGLEWLEGDSSKAFLAFRRHNSRSTQLALKPEELKLSVLAHRFEPLLRECVDPIRSDARARDLAKQAFTLKRLTNVLYRMLPFEYRGQRALEAPPECVEAAAKRLTASYEHTRDYLLAHGLVHDELVSTPSMVDILMALFDAVPSATSDDFAFHWMAHVVSGSLFFGRPRLYQKTLLGVLQGGSYEQLKHAMVDVVPEGRPATFSEERLHPVPARKTSMGPNGALYALASASRPESMQDLADPETTFPDSEMRLRPLCHDPVRGLLAHYALLTPHAAEVIAAHGGWTHDAYQELRPGAAQLHVHQLPEPSPTMTVEEVGDWLIEERTPLLATMLDEFLGTVVGPLHEPASPPF